MKKRILIVFIAMILVLLIAMSVPVHAGPPETVSGLWQYQPFIENVRTAGGNTFLDTFENGKWTGTFSGTSTEDGEVVIHSSGAWSFRAIVSFEGKVDDRAGELTMLVVGSRPDVLTDWTGRWVIISGTDELAALHGQGTWWGPGAPNVGEWGDIYYGGNMHFEPE